MARWIIRYGKEPGDQVTVYSVPTGTMTAVKVTTQPFTAINTKGRIFCGIVRKTRWFDSDRLSRCACQVLDALISIGAFDNDHAAKAVASTKDYEAKHRVAYDAAQMAENAKDAGIKLTASQIRQIDKLKKAAA